MQQADDIDLVKRVLAKEPAAFDEFFDSYFGRLCRFCAVRVRDPNAVEDIVQETLLKTMRNLHSYRGEAMLFSWMCQICRNEINTWYKRHGRRDEMLLSLDDDPGVRAALESFGVTLQQQKNQALDVKQLVQLTLDHLPEKYGKALEWKYLEGFSVAEIAERLGMGRLATQSMLARARKAFRQSFRDLQQELQTPPVVK